MKIIAGEKRDLIPIHHLVDHGLNVAGPPSTTGTKNEVDPAVVIERLPQHPLMLRTRNDDDPIGARTMEEINLMTKKRPTAKTKRSLGRVGREPCTATCTASRDNTDEAARHGISAKYLGALTQFRMRATRSRYV